MFIILALLNRICQLQCNLFFVIYSYLCMSGYNGLYYYPHIFICSITSFLFAVICVGKVLNPYFPIESLLFLCFSCKVKHFFLKKQCFWFLGGPFCAFWFSACPGVLTATKIKYCVLFYCKNSIRLFPKSASECLFSLCHLYLCKLCSWSEQLIIL